MTRNTDTHDRDADLEQQLRTMLRERADDVEATPALYERVQRGTARADRRPLWLGLAAAAAVVAAAIVVLPGLLAQQPDIDIAPRPPSERPTGDPTTEDGAAPTPVDEVAAVDALVDLGAVVATGDGLHIDDRVLPLDASRGVVVAMDARAARADGPDPARDVVVVLGFADGTVGLVDLLDGEGVAVRHLDEVAGFEGYRANGGGVVFTPDGQGIAWFDGTDLVVLPLRSEPGAERVLPLEGDAPADLVIEDFVDFDAPVIVASRPDGGLWSQPMDVGGVFDTAPVGAPFELSWGVGATDGLVLADLSPVSVRPDPSGAGDETPASVAVGEDGPLVLPTMADARTVVASTDDEGVFLLLDPSTGRGLVAVAGDGDGPRFPYSFEAAGITAAAPLSVPDEVRGAAAGPVDVSEASAAGERGSSAAAGDGPVDTAPLAGSLAPPGAPGLPVLPLEEGPVVAVADLGTDHPIVSVEQGTLVVVDPDGTSESYVALYGDEPFATVEGRLTDVAVRPGSTLEDLTVAVVSEAEGEVSIRFARLLDGERVGAPVVAAVADGPVSALVWAEDGSAVAWSDDAGIHAVDLTADSAVGEETTLAGPLAGDVLDWSWSDQLEDGLVGTLAVGVRQPDGTRGTRLAPAVRDGDGTLRLDEPGPALPGVRLEAHVGPVLADAPVWRFTETADEVVVELSGDGESFVEVGRVAVTARPAGYVVHDGVGIVVTAPTTDDGIMRVLADGNIQEIPLWFAYDVLG